MDSTNHVTHDFAPFFRVYKDGHIERLLVTPRVPAATDPKTGVQSKDVIISSDPEIKARVFIPKIDGPDQKLPLVVYYHGGGFCIGSAFNIVTQTFLTSLISQTPAIVVAVGYRLAPEHRLPAAYEDCCAGFQWVISHSSVSGPEPWLNQYANFSRVFLAGESAGANLAHYTAVQASVNGLLSGLNLRGLLSVHPFFTQQEPDKLIQYLYPASTGSTDDPKLNPAADPNLEKMGCSRVLVCVAERDWLKPRGVAYYETLKKSKWGGSVDFVEDEGEDHCFHLFKPTSEKARALIEKLGSFISYD